MSEFQLQIRLGNALMRDPWDIANALRDAADSVQAGMMNGAIRDVNGNTVGHFEITGDSQEGDDE